MPTLAAPSRLRVSGVLITVVSAVFATQAVTQEFNGVALGDPLTKAQTAWPKARPMTKAGQTAPYVLTGDGFTAGFCQGLVNFVSQEIGHSFHDFAATVQLETAKSGAPDTRVDNFRVEQGEVSRLRSRWRRRSFTYEVSFFVAPGQPASVSESFEALVACSDR